MRAAMLFSIFAGFSACCSAQSAATKIKVACIGNSITEGNMGPSYVPKLQSLLGSGYMVENDGISGTTMLKKGDNPYWKNGKLGQVFSLKPNIVTIKLGTNDTKPQNWDSHKDAFKKDYLAMIDTLTTLPTKPAIYLVLPAPIFSNTFNIRDSALKKIIVIIKEIAGERSLPIIDVNTPLLGLPNCFKDGVHPSDAGADTIARVIYRRLTAATGVTSVKKEPPLRATGGCRIQAKAVLPFNGMHDLPAALCDPAGRSLNVRRSMVDGTQSNTIFFTRPAKHYRE
jgi:lysophospholipase L1-like esterase